MFAGQMFELETENDSKTQTVGYLKYRRPFKTYRTRMQYKSLFASLVSTKRIETTLRTLCLLFLRPLTCSQVLTLITVSMLSVFVSAKR